MTDIEGNTPLADDEDLDLRNPGGEAADEEADAHGDHLARPTDVEYGDEDDA